jgi:Uncharacterized protein encoded in hypervariable junctions of pilus gene clusters
MQPTVPNYGIRVFWSEEDHEYVAVCDELPQVSALGGTFEEAVSEFRIALEAVAEVYAEDREELPPARRVETAFSGQLRVRLGKSLHREAARLAEAEGISLNQFIQNAVSRECARREPRADTYSIHRPATLNFWDPSAPMCLRLVNVGTAVSSNAWSVEAAKTKSAQMKGFN